MAAFSRPGFRRETGSLSFSPPSSRSVRPLYDHPLPSGTTFAGNPRGSGTKFSSPVSPRDIGTLLAIEKCGTRVDIPRNLRESRFPPLAAKPRRYFYKSSRNPGTKSPSAGFQGCARYSSRYTVLADRGKRSKRKRRRKREKEKKGGKQRNSRIRA